MNSAPHIIKDFDLALAELKNDVLTMAAKTRHNLERAIQALLGRDAELSNSVIADDDEVDELERVIDKAGMSLLVKYHPMASDLRFVVSSMKISMNLERISDHATNIAKRAKKIIATAELIDVTLVEPVYTLADELLRDAISSFSDGNGVLGASLHVRDKELDKLYKAATAQFGDRIEDTQGRSQEYVHLIFIVRSLERVGDLASNIGEDSVYLDRAKDIRHMSRGERELT
ncbi:MAG: phosphate signaling complex protein PhoU [Akkermansiaceae bacterium]|jgi:phosphate transport system protein|nr:phosphate signaling complex protein PhoU [Akkermansiaceae bacterium]MDP4645550.1 phosphate signaling complex protein PhoU [Akkermansiaceae bacterium]MDP4720359.1 phosphate signaling complex protein PhoU [Akkermansiaceae bacterium]MDP4779366.1 phosphate signaling complex protein PhoU [Akkermansiaceae bacterium]MDP4848656.1 phosphate signaling complex protein PhoU [Akkermansiaceae bacterium]